MWNDTSGTRNHIWNVNLGDTFFLAFDSGLFYWADGIFYEVEIQDLPTAHARLSAGQIRIDGEARGAGVWVASSHWVYALTFEGEDLNAYILADNFTPDDLTAYGEHHFAMVAQGDLWIHDGANRFRYQLPEEVLRVWGNNGTHELFMGGQEPVWWLREDNNLVQILNVPLDGAWFLDPKGQLIVEII